MKHLKIFLTIITLLVVVRPHAQITEEESVDFEILKNLELFELVYKKIDMEYVDEPDPGHLMRTAIDAMLAELDPYTNYIPESQIEDFKLMTTGQYGGIGAIIRKLDDHVGIVDPYESYPAQKAGLRAGDKFIEIDGKNVEGLNTEEISSKLKGKPGSDVIIKVDRSGEIIERTLSREEVKLSPVPYFGMVNDEVGYIKFTSFTHTAHEEVSKAFESLKKNSGMKKLILDLRGNGGGLLIEAVKIVNMFVPKGSPIVSIKGRYEEDSRGYSASLKPDDTEMPIVVLVDEGSASASEIVSGALQDLDRAVIVGKQSFGKGLVQRPLDLKYNARVKVTIAKYYTPSGRCIQKLDYSNRQVGEHASAVSDSLIRKFQTKNGREVIDGRGVEPDVKVEQEELSRLTAMLVLENVIFDFATQYRNENESMADAQKFRVTDELYAKFKAYALSREFDYTTAASEEMETLRKIAEEEGVFEDGSTEFDQLMEKFKPSKDRDLDRYKKEIIMLLEDEMVGRYFYQKGRIEHSLEQDEYIQKAVEILNDNSRYNQILNKEN